MKLPNITHFNPQTGSLGRPFRLSGLRKHTNKIDNNIWIYSFKYIDEKGGFFELKLYPNGKVEKL